MGRDSQREYDALIIGAGFSGLYSLYRLRRDGFRAAILEAGGGVGGTWYWNRYPGARCDVPSLQYSYSFSEELQQEWHWTELYATQPEIEKYLNHVADRFDLRRDIYLNHHVASVVFNESSHQWELTTSSGEHFQSGFCLMAVGGYSTPITPDIPGLEDFAGEVYYTASWPRHGVEFKGKRVGVIGTGSSGMQVITEIAKTDCEHLYVFQRTPNFCVPANNKPMDPDYEAEYKRHYAQHRTEARNSRAGVVFPSGEGRTVELTQEEFDARAERAGVLGGVALLAAFPDHLTDEQANARVAEHLRGRIRSQVRDREVAELLCAKTHFVGSRRILVESGYFSTFNSPKVTLVDLATTPITRAERDSLVTSDHSYEIDLLVLATGFDSGSGTFLQLNPIGKGGVDLQTHWQHGPRTFLGLTIAGFPNLFMLWGPGSPGVRSVGSVMAEIQTDWIADLMVYMRSHEVQLVEPLVRSEDDWTDHVADVANRSLLIRDETTFVGANVPGKPRVYAAYIGGLSTYRHMCDLVRDQSYEGFCISYRDGHVHCASNWQGPSLDRVDISAI